MCSYYWPGLHVTLCTTLRRPPEGAALAAHAEAASSGGLRSVVHSNCQITNFVEDAIVPVPEMEEYHEEDIIEELCGKKEKTEA